MATMATIFLSISFPPQLLEACFAQRQRKTAVVCAQIYEKKTKVFVGTKDT